MSATTTIGPYVPGPAGQDAGSGGHGPEGTRRDFLSMITGAFAFIGCAAVAWSLIDTMNPAADMIAAGAPIDLDISKIEPGQQIVVRWRGSPILIVNRTPEMLKTSAGPEAGRGSRGPEFQGAPAAALRAELAPLFQPGICRAGRHLHPSRLPAAIPAEAERHASQCRTGRAAICVRAMDRNTTLRGASTRTCRRPTICRCRRTTLPARR